MRKKKNTVENYFVSDNSESVALDIKSLIDFISDSRYNKKMHKQFINYLKFYEKGKTIKTFTIMRNNENQYKTKQRAGPRKVALDR